MIVIEDRLQELFETLPDIVVGSGSYTPHFNYGTQPQLYRYLNDLRKSVDRNGGNIYPVIWMLPPFQGEGLQDKLVTTDLNLVLATLTIAELSNKERKVLSFDNVLIPLYYNVIKALQSSNFSRITQETEYGREGANVIRFYNYGSDDNEQHQSTDIWDAMRIETQIEMTTNCLIPINY